MIAYDGRMQREYSNYIGAHERFTRRQARQRILEFEAVDLSGIEAFSYEAFINAMQTITPNQQATLNRISSDIGQLQGDLVDLENHVQANIKKKTAQMKDVNVMLNKMQHVAKEMSSLMNKLPTKIRENDNNVMRVKNVGDLIRRDAKDLRAASKALQAGSGGQIINIVPTVKQPDISTKTVYTLKELYDAYFGSLAGTLGHAYETLLSAWVGTMPTKVLQELEDWATNLAKTYRSPRYKEEITTYIEDFDIPDTKGAKILVRPEGNEGLIDWWVNEDEVGLRVQMTMSQKEYREKDTSGELMLKALTTNISGKVMQVAGSVQQAYALYRAFASPSSRGTKDGMGKSLAEAIVRHTLIDDIFGSGIDSASDLLINRVFYSSQAVINRLFDNENNFNLTSATGGKRLEIKVAGQGKGASPGKYYEDVRAARMTEYGAAGVWVSEARLAAIQKANFEIHWRFEKAWFENVAQSLI